MFFNDSNISWLDNWKNAKIVSDWLLDLLISMMTVAAVEWDSLNAKFASGHQRDSFVPKRPTKEGERSLSALFIASSSKEKLRSEWRLYYIDASLTSKSFNVSAFVFSCYSTRNLYLFALATLLCSLLKSLASQLWVENALFQALQNRRFLL